MTWSDFERAILFRLLVRLNANERLWRSVDDFLKLYAYPPGHPVRAEVLRLLRQIATSRAVVTDAIDALPKPYRPGVDPWLSSGLSARLRPDFESRGITDRPPSS